MDVRSKMVNYRKNLGLTIRQMSVKCDCSEGLLKIIEEGGVTHPKIAKRIKKAYKLSNSEMGELVPKCRNEESEHYDPEMYMEAPERVCYEVNREFAEIIGKDVAEMISEYCHKNRTFDITFTEHLSMRSSRWTVDEWFTNLMKIPGISREDVERIRFAMHKLNYVVAGYENPNEPCKKNTYFMPKIRSNEEVIV